MRDAGAAAAGMARTSRSGFGLRSSSGQLARRARAGTRYVAGPPDVPLAMPSAAPSCRPGTASRRCSGPASRDGRDGQRTGRAPARSQAAAAASASSRSAMASLKHFLAKSAGTPRASAICSQLARRAGPRGCRSAGCRGPSPLPGPRGDAHGRGFPRPRRRANSRTGDACNEAVTGHGPTEWARGRAEGPHPDEQGVDPPSVLPDQASTPTASLASEASWVCAALTTFARLLWVSS